MRGRRGRATSRACSWVRPAAGQGWDDVLEAERGDAGEEAGAALGDGEVGDVADVAVEGARVAARLAIARPGRAAVRRGPGSGRRPRGRPRPAAGRRRVRGVSEAAIMSRRAATTTTSICGGAPSVAATPPTTRWSRTAWSIGIGICSCAWKRTAASSSLGSSIAGSRSVRTTTRWLAIPSRTRLRSLFSEKRARSASATARGRRPRRRGRLQVEVARSRLRSALAAPWRGPRQRRRCRPRSRGRRALILFFLAAEASGRVIASAESMLISESPQNLSRALPDRESPAAQPMRLPADHPVEGSGR